MWGLPVTPACQIHDWMYSEGETSADKEEADRIFLNNMNRIINADSRCGFMKRLRYSRSKKYYLAVKYGGGDAFWEGKNDPRNIRDARTIMELLDDDFI